MEAGLLGDRLYGLSRIDEDIDAPGDEDAAARASLTACTSNLAKGILGLSIAALPHAFATVGVGPSLLMLAATALLTRASCIGLARASQRTGRFSYSELAAYEFGWPGALLMEVSLLVNSGGMLVAYLVVLADLMVTAHRQLHGVARYALPHATRWMGRLLGGGSGGPQGGWWLLGVAALDKPGGGGGDDDWAPVEAVLLVIVVAFIAPLASFRRLRSIASASLLGVLALCLWSLATLVAVAVGASRGSLHGLHLLPPPDAWAGSPGQLLGRLVGVLPVLLCAYIVQFSFHPIIIDLQPFSQRRIATALSRALALTSALYASTTLGSLALFGDAVSDNVLTDFTASSLAPTLGSLAVARAMYGAVHASFFVSVLTSYPLHVHPARDAAWRLVGGRSEMSGSAFYGLTYALLAAVYMLAVLVTSITSVLHVVGATAGVVIAFLMPGALMLRNAAASEAAAQYAGDLRPVHLAMRPGRERALGWLLIGAGMALSAAGMALALSPK